MAFFDRFRKKETRNISLADLDASMDNALANGGLGISGSKTAALNLAAVFNAATIRTNYLAMVPLKVYKERPDGGKDTDKLNPAYKLLHDKPNPLMTSFSWRVAMEFHSLFYGDGFSRIIWDTVGRPESIWLLNSSKIKPKLSADGRELYWVYRNTDNRFLEFPDSDIIHIPGMSPDGITSDGVIKNAARSLYFSDVAEGFGVNFFKNGLNAGGTIQAPGPLSDQARTNLKKTIDERSKPGNAHKTMLLEEGMTWNKITFSPEESQFLATREYQDKEIARWFNLPLRALKMADASGLRNVEQIQIEMVQGTFLPRYVAWEQELKAKLFPDSDGETAEFVIDGLLRGDAKTRAEVHQIYRLIGTENADEIRMMENKNPIGGEKGEEYWGQPNLAANKSNTEEKPKEEPAPDDETTPDEGGDDGKA
ncbi:phage portal protein [Candidatus Pacearchaeota archaeon]|nr:phage portal protein [Candidatus Pacearchaeota archaeon]